MILDTSFLIDLMRHDPAAIALLDKLEAGSDPLLVPAPALYELWEGIERSDQPLRELEAVESLLDAYAQVDLDAAAAKRAGVLSAQLIRRGQDIDDVDLLIAGIAVDRHAPVVTANGKHFARIDDLQVKTY